MDKISVNAVDVSYRSTETTKTGNESKEVTDDFKKLLQGKQEDDGSSQEVSKDTEQEKEDIPENPKTATDSTDGLLAAYQMAQGMRPEMIQAEPKTQTDTEAVALEPEVSAEAELPLQTPEETTITQSQTPIREKSQFVAEGKSENRTEVQSADLDAPSVKEPEKLAEETDLSTETGQENESASMNKDTTKAATVKEDQGTEENPVKEQAVQVSTSVTPAKVETREIKPESITRMHVREPEELPQKLTDELTSKLMNGAKEFEIHIEPEHLGKIAVKILYEAGQATVSILCSEKRTLDMLGQSAREIGNVIDRNLGGTTTIIVEKQETDYLNQTGDENQNKGQNAEQEQKKEKGGESKAEDAEQFLQKLRLGLAV